MPKKNPESVTKEFLVEQLQVFEKRFDEKLGRKSKILESKIEFARKDMREHMVSIAEGLNKKIESVDKKNIQRIGFLSQSIETLDKKVDNLGHRLERVETKLGEHDQQLSQLNEKMDRVVEKVECHDVEITSLKSEF